MKISYEAIKMNHKKLRPNVYDLTLENCLAVCGGTGICQCNIEEGLSASREIESAALCSRYCCSALRLTILNYLGWEWNSNGIKKSGKCTDDEYSL